jgi:hypothetical protein
MTYYCFPNYAITWSRVKTYLENEPQIIVIKTNIDIKFNAHGTFLKQPSSVRSKPIYLKAKKIRSLWEQENQMASKQDSKKSATFLIS